MSEYGNLESDASRAFVRFERELSAAIDVVWDLISTADGLALWLSPAAVDLRMGGSVDLDFKEEGLAGGEIISFEPGAVLEYHWQFPGEPDSVIRLELTETQTGTQLVLEHRLLPLDQAVAYGAGWHAHLDHLQAVATGETPDDWHDRFQNLLPHYAANV